MPEQVLKLVDHARTQMARVIVGQTQALDELLLAILCGGHAIIEGVPGVGKTLAVKTLARICQLSFQRVQCTPDLMPADVIGTNIFHLRSGDFQLHRGPVFTDILLVDEINRTPPRTQSALLEAMEERQVTIDRDRLELPRFFTVFATQNPVEFEGTYPLPEAQLDRFLMKIRFDYPDEDHESEILRRHQNSLLSHDLDRFNLEPIDTRLLLAARQEIAAITVEDSVLRYQSALVRRTRDWPSLSLGASPRAGIFLAQVGKAMAAVEGRTYLIPDDVKKAALPVLRHRLILRPEADLENLTPDHLIREILETIEVPG